MTRAGYALPRRWAAALFALTAVAGLSACAEITRFEHSDGTTLYHVNCRDGMNLFESCQDAALRVCPNGYTKADVELTLGWNQERNRKLHNADNFFVCK
ncbi:hypothetical protein [Magnetospirillum molischianum]|uniref:Lipoprotein n=1 Tax=Magnetospirillum molischianum DSM 120 TaxID=1150626 RepID=H8FSK9_MAGML|nr:hypothetical protein [Magnetospirillum molischianum]CCG41347.1 conserved exported hypothetical protein [Magnetospirillum molischianum DSM 120]